MASYLEDMIVVEKHADSVEQFDLLLRLTQAGYKLEDEEASEDEDDADADADAEAAMMVVSTIMRKWRWRMTTQSEWREMISEILAKLRFENMNCPHRVQAKMLRASLRALPQSMTQRIRVLQTNAE